jgi:hypothetical protein
MPSPAENLSPENPEVAATARFVVSGAAEPGVAPRVLELFAKRGLVPDDFHARAANGRQTIEVRAGAMTADAAAYIGRCLRQIVHVERVLVSREERIADGA